jgi:hypothetical protein
MGQWIAFSGSRPNAKISGFAAQMFLPLQAFGYQKKVSKRIQKSAGDFSRII